MPKGGIALYCHLTCSKNPLLAVSTIRLPHWDFLITSYPVALVTLTVITALFCLPAKLVRRWGRLCHVLPKGKSEKTISYHISARST